MNRILRYFISYIFHSKTRQKLLLLAVAGLFLSSFSLMVIQSVMGGLQNGLIKRSKNIHGESYFQLNTTHPQFQNKFDQLIQNLDQAKITYIKEYEVEVILKHDTFVTPAILRGVDFSYITPDFLKGKDQSQLIVGSDLSNKLNTYVGSDIEIMSPNHLDYMLSLNPRSVQSSLSDYFVSELSEIDAFYTWSRIELVQNLVRFASPNIIRIFDDKVSDVSELLVSDDFKTYYRWEDRNQSLVKALKLETSVMFFLFISMSCLVAVSIISGFLIFYSKVKKDLISFWILGLPQQNLYKLLAKFNLSLGLVSTLSGLVFALLFLFILDKASFDFMPDVFVERKLPIHLTPFAIISSFSIPCFVSFIFSMISLSFFKKDSDSFIKQIRSIS